MDELRQNMKLFVARDADPKDFDTRGVYSLFCRLK